MRTLLILLATLFCVSSSLRIAIYNPIFGHSHTKFMASITDVLGEAGHNVTTIASLIKPSDYKKLWKYGKTIEVEQDPRIISTVAAMGGKGGFQAAVWTMAPSPMALMKAGKDMSRMFTEQCEFVLQNEEFMRKVESEKFDIGIAEGFEFCGHAVFEKVGVKSIITLSSSTLFDHLAILTGVPLVPSYVPGGMSEFSDKMTFTERAKNAVGTYFGNKFFMNILEDQNEIAKKVLGNDFKDIHDIVSETPFLFTNSLPYMDFPHPIIHKVKEIGGINVQKAKKVDKVWDEILSRKSKNVLISFGSVAKSKDMPDNLKENVIATAKKFPEVLFIWKYEADDLSNLPENLVLSKWTPQTDLLGDSRLSLFITHGGLGSTTEIAYSGSPAIVVPLFADQMRNAQVLIRQGVAVTLSKYDFADSDKLSDALKEMLGNANYKENAVKLASLIANVPFTPKEILVRNIEFVGRFGNLPQLDPFGRHQTVVQYFLLDIIAVVAVVSLVVVALVVFLLKKLFSLCRVTPKPKND